MDEPLQLKGLAIVLKVALLGMALSLPDWRAELFVLVFVLSGLIAQAPGEVRGIGWRPRWARGDGCGSSLHPHPKTGE